MKKRGEGGGDGSRVGVRQVDCGEGGGESPSPSGY